MKFDGLGIIKKVKHIIRNRNRLSPEDRAEFDMMNTKYNGEATIIISAFTIILLSISMFVAFVSYSFDSKGVREFWIIFPYHCACIVLSAAALIIMLILRKKDMLQRKISDVVAMVQTCLIMSIFMAVAHVEVPYIGIKNIDVFIIIMFTVGTFLRFKIDYTLVIEAIYTVATIIFICCEKQYLANFYPSIINVICAFIAASGAAFMHWDSRKKYYLSTKKLEALASSDYLTRLQNRRSFDFYIDQEWHRAGSENLPIALFFIDVDHFKKYNDLYGHVEGDSCLCAVAGIISDSVRKNDFVARYGGEEFVVSLTGVNAEIAMRIANNILNGICGLKMPHGDSVAPYVTLSLGCMIYRPGRQKEIDQNSFIKMADAALYMAKEQGRNRFVIHPNADTA
jgi:diguanylate cyclase (GGDEF)-like protein